MLDLRFVAIVGGLVLVGGAVASRLFRLPVPTFEPGVSRSPFATPLLFRRTAAPREAEVAARSASAPVSILPAPEPRTSVLNVAPAVRAQRLDSAINALRDRDPGLSASTTLTRQQRRVLIILAVLLVIGLIVNFTWTLIALTGASTIAYVASLLFRVKLFRLSLGPGHQHEITEAEARAIPDRDLPAYTILVPAFHEPEVVAKLIESVGKMDYPTDKLQILLLLEEDDTETVAAALASPGGERFEIVLVPQAAPRTKPKALNYGLQFARGEMLTIYDVEDRPEPLQLRRAVVAFARAPEGTACLQAQLSYFNPTQNFITRWFAIEYLMWFTQLLPGLSYLEAPIPLGGTSNHFRREVLEEMGGWDPFNVTEDADLGVRLHRMGYRTGVLQSETLEEANSDFVNWVKQRSRWYKGYVQTWIVHMRHPRELWRDLGWRSFWRFNFFVGGTPFIALINPIFWAMTLAWFIGHPSIIRDIYPAPIFYTAILCWLIGNFVCVYVLLLCAVQTRRADLFVAALLSPFYWIMMAVAASKAFVQLVFQPSYWEKTTHGLDVALERRRRLKLVTPASTGH
jgi:cellulose synthase/poly-beta-1,6-N-acetylglucosamine synthase-like glycosyltransferase